MRLYMSSFHFGNQPELFTKLIGGNHNVALILNAGDGLPQDIRSERVLRQIKELEEINLIGTDIDLRDYFGHEEELKEELKKYGAVWVPGGSAFILRRAMRDSGFDLIINQMLQEDKIVYGGYSAGICVLAPTLKGIDLADKPQEVERLFHKEIIWEGLNIIPYTPIPHYKSERSEYVVMDDVVKFMENEGLPYKTLRDGEVIIVKNENQELKKEIKENFKKR